MRVQDKILSQVPSITFKGLNISAGSIFKEVQHSASIACALPTGNKDDLFLHSCLLEKS